jgi:hypothetical protein
VDGKVRQKVLCYLGEHAAVVAALAWLKKEAERYRKLAEEADERWGSNRSALVMWLVPLTKRESQDRELARYYWDQCSKARDSIAPIEKAAGIVPKERRAAQDGHYSDEERDEIKQQLVDALHPAGTPSPCRKKGGK